MFQTLITEPQKWIRQGCISLEFPCQKLPILQGVKTKGKYCIIYSLTVWRVLHGVFLFWIQLNHVAPSCPSWPLGICTKEICKPECSSRYGRGHQATATIWTHCSTLKDIVPDFASVCFFCKMTRDRDLWKADREVFSNTPFKWKPIYYAFCLQRNYDRQSKDTQCTWKPFLLRVFISAVCGAAILSQASEFLTWR